MQKTVFNVRSVFRFKHFSRKGYSLFSVLGREVVVCTLTVAMLSHAKAEGISTMGEADDNTLQRSELKLGEVVVTGSRAPLTQSESAKIVSVITRDEVERAAVQSINDVLKLVSGVDVRQRGGFGVQTDISVRGGNFDQITILLNGVNISSPHTGHLSADFPISPDDIERIEVIEGAAARVFGTAAFNGVINIVTKGSRMAGKAKTEAMVAVDGGSYGAFGANGRGTIVTGNVANTLSMGYQRSDGATPNSDFTSTKVYYQGDWVTQNMRLGAQVAYSYKPYAANTFYGAASTDQWESNERWMAAVNGDIRLGKVHVLPSLYFNRWYDHYQWHKDSPAGENFHKVESKGAALSGWMPSKIGRTSFGVEVRDERIRSTKLGLLLPEDQWVATGGHDAEADKFYKYRDQRCNVSLFLEHDVVMSRWTLSMGLLANMNDALDTKWRVYPGVDVSYRPADNWKLYASWNMALRMPTFTDLYYSGTGIEGNSNLKPEKTSDIQLGAQVDLQSVVAEAQLFYSHKTDMIDWVTHYTGVVGGEKVTDNIFHSVNFQMNNYGAEVNVKWLPQRTWKEACPLKNVRLMYSYIYQQSDYDVEVIASKYAMDYLRHKVVLSADTRLWKKLNLSMSWRWQDRVGEANPSYALLDGKLSWDENRWMAYVSGQNILDKQYFDYGSIPQPGFTIMGGVKVRF